jgi:zinc/manganese transport system substrate-binding protein
VGTCAAVSVLVPEGADPHEFEPSAQQVAALREADLVVSVGLGLEEALTPVIDSARADGTEVVAIGERVETIPLAGGGGTDPHVWQDPARMAEVVPVIAAAVAAAGDCDPGDAAAAYADELRGLDEELAATYGAIPTEARRLVTNHDAFGYLADRYDFEIVGVVIPGGSTLAEPSTRDLADLASVVEREDVPAIFAETTDSTELADALAAEVGRDVGVVTLYSDALGAPDSGASTYVAMMQTNAARISDALAGGQT